MAGTFQGMAGNIENTSLYPLTVSLEMKENDYSFLFNFSAELKLSKVKVWNI